MIILRLQSAADCGTVSQLHRIIEVLPVRLYATLNINQASIEIVLTDVVTNPNHVIIFLLLPHFTAGSYPLLSSREHLSIEVDSLPSSLVLPLYLDRNHQ